MYCVIVGDIIDSKKLDTDTVKEKKERAEHVLELVNEKYYKIIMADFGIVRGDAFEGVLYSQVEAIDVIQDLIRKFIEEVGVSLRISCVTDELTIDEFDRNKSDGPAFHKAVEEIEKLKKKNSKHWLQVSVVTKTDDKILIDTITELLSTITSYWTEKQREIAFAMSVYNQQKYVSKELGVSPSVVNKQLKACNYQTYHNAWFHLKKHIEMTEEELVKKSNADYTLLYSIGTRKNSERKYVEAEKYLNQALKTAKKIYVSGDIRLVPIYNELVHSYVEHATLVNIAKEKNRLLNLAKKSILTSIDIQSEFPSDARKYVQTLNAKGILLLEMDNLEEAMQCFKEAKSLVCNFWGKNSYYIYVCYNNIAGTYKRLKEYELAEKYLMLCLSEIEKNKDMNINGYYMVCYNMGLICKETGRESESEIWFDITNELKGIS